MIQGLEHFCKEKLRELALSSLEKRRLRRMSSICINTCKEGAKRTEQSFFQWVPVTLPEPVITNWNTGGFI